MLRRFLGNNGTRERGPSLQVLIDERAQVEDAFRFVAEHPDREVLVEVGGEKFKVVADGYGKEIKSA